MTHAVARILEEVEHLSTPERADLADRLVGSLLHDVPPEIERAQLAEVQRRIAQVESGEASLISGDEALARVRALAEASLRAR